MENFHFSRGKYPVIDRTKEKQAQLRQGVREVCTYKIALSQSFDPSVETSESAFDRSCHCIEKPIDLAVNRLSWKEA